MIGNDTPVLHVTHDGTPIYDLIRQRTGIDPAVIGARPYWSFLEACLRLFGETQDPFVAVGETTAGAEGR